MPQTDRVSAACDRCHRKKVKCSRSSAARARASRRRLSPNPAAAAEPPSPAIDTRSQVSMELAATLRDNEYLRERTQLLETFLAHLLPPDSPRPGLHAASLDFTPRAFRRDLHTTERAQHGIVGVSRHTGDGEQGGPSGEGEGSADDGDEQQVRSLSELRPNLGLVEQVAWGGIIVNDDEPTSRQRRREELERERKARAARKTAKTGRVHGRRVAKRGEPTAKREGKLGK
ncbi:hypothetical protein C8F01DRAFT_1091385 [Mycena amicta]|nr:hypothetical protein C8F01DRAFT_1262881 [Mycena amicta]KAJ7051678.1 hypothetical protein C8F01DRAFT_1091385 [Mycena amicta]